jgi:hypothetical protein
MLRGWEIERRKRLDAIVFAERYGLGTLLAHRRPTMLLNICSVFFAASYWCRCHDGDNRWSLF